MLFMELKYFGVVQMHAYITKVTKHTSLLTLLLLPVSVSNLRQGGGGPGGALSQLSLCQSAPHCVSPPPPPPTLT